MVRGFDEGDFPKFAWDLNRNIWYAGMAQIRPEKTPLKSELTIFPKNLAWDAEMPVKPGPDGMYPRAIPGKTVVI